MLPPRTEPLTSGSCCAMFVVSREQLLTRSRSAYRRAHRRFAGGQGLCHEGPLRDAELATTTACERAMLDANTCCSHELRRIRSMWSTEKCNHLLFKTPGDTLTLGHLNISACLPSRQHARTACSLPAKPTDLPRYDNNSRSHDKAHAIVFEHLHHVLIGGLPLRQDNNGSLDTVSESTWCRGYLPRQQCAGSPCKGS